MAYTLILIVQLIFLIFPADVLGIECNDTWNYQDSTGCGPDDWYEDYPDCATTSTSIQSPINIIVSNVVTSNNLTDLQFVNYGMVPPNSFTLFNTAGHTVQVNVPTNLIHVKGGGLGATYALEQFHFHWGSTNSNGSEHNVNGYPSGMEIHLVHYNADKYLSVSAAENDPTGILVFGIFVNVTNSSNTDANLGEVVTTLTNAKTFKNGVNATMNAFAMKGFLPSGALNYYRYNGSLTTPGCKQSVIWNVFENPVYITASQMNTFRNTVYNADGNKLTTNHRPLQALNGRLIYYHKQGQYSASNSLSVNAVYMVATLLLATLIY